MMNEESALSVAQRQCLLLINAIPSAVIGIDIHGLIIYWNRTAEHLFGIAADQAIGLPLAQVGIPWDGDETLARIAQCLRQDRSTRLTDIHFIRSDGSPGLLEATITVLKGEASLGYLLLGTDITERKVLDGQLIQAQKLQSIGQLAAGIAHEINTPIQYIGDNIHFLEDSYAGLEKLLAAYQRLHSAARSGSVDKALLDEIEALSKAIDLVYLHREIPIAIQQSLEGIGRVSKIVQAIKQFSYPDWGEKVAIDLNTAIESIINITRNEWKYLAKMETDLDPKLPQVSCLPGEINQTILNIILNAVHAIAAAHKDSLDVKGVIAISTRRNGKWIEVRIRDTGTGIPQRLRNRIFDPFFTTKEMGQGTGQGLAIAHAVIVEKHGGTLAFETKEGIGTTFIIRLPWQSAAD